MSSVSSSFSTSQYYALPTQAGTTLPLPKQASTAQLYLQADANANAGTDTVRLSVAAQAYLQNKAGSYSPAQAGSSFTLTTAQQQQLNGILDKYKGEPLTQDTFNQIQDDLKANGLSPEQLSAQDRTQAFNPELEFLNASNGLASALPSATDEAAKKSNYISGIYQRLQSFVAQDITS